MMMHNQGFTYGVLEERGFRMKSGWEEGKTGGNAPEGRRRKKIQRRGLKGVVRVGK